MKRCPTCGVEKPRDEFSKNRCQRDGLGSYCKPCSNARNREWKEKNQELIRERNRAYVRRSRRGWRDPQKRAHNAIQYALEGGRIVRPDSCESCGAKGRVSAHHEDYSKPLDVHWLCYRCHRRVHAGLITLAGVSGAD
jgi:hypothetical protein